MISTKELGPRLGTPAANFCVLNHENHVTTLDDLMGERGLVLGFTSDIWEPASIRRVLWFQRHDVQFARMNVKLALVVCNEPHTLYGYSVASVEPVNFPLLADVRRDIHGAFNMEGYAGLVVIDRSYTMRDKWIMPAERVWPKPGELIQTLEAL
ncbi:MAG: hypothetical protein CL610_20415 [Anaerolineaceae bacterium]|nr:hypothetical protein [Anaerolineaceae bacterium]